MTPSAIQGAFEVIIQKMSVCKKVPQSAQPWHMEGRKTLEHHSLESLNNLGFYCKYINPY